MFRWTTQQKRKMGKSSSDEGAKAAKAGLCACGICCALCIGIPLLIIIIIIIIIVVVVSNASDDINDAIKSSECDRVEASDGACTWDLSCKGNRTCVNGKCSGSSGCWTGWVPPGALSRRRRARQLFALSMMWRAGWRGGERHARVWQHERLTCAATKWEETIGFATSSQQRSHHSICNDDDKAARCTADAWRSFIEFISNRYLDKIIYLLPIHFLVPILFYYIQINDLPFISALTTFYPRSDFIFLIRNFCQLQLYLKKKRIASSLIK